MVVTLPATERKLAIPAVVTSGDLGTEYINFVRFIRSQNLSGNTLYAYCGAIAALADSLKDKGYWTRHQRRDGPHAPPARPPSASRVVRN